MTELLIEMIYPRTRPLAGLCDGEDLLEPRGPECSPISARPQNNVEPSPTHFLRELPMRVTT
jgi:hypothetical protein